MTRFLVSGLVNIETTLRVDGFPIAYSPNNFPFFGIKSTVSGVGYNISKALATLGSEVQFLGLTGADPAGELVRQTLQNTGIRTDHLQPLLSQTAQSIILYDPTGKRMIFTDLKDVQKQTYPLKTAERLLTACDLAVLCNINYSRPLLHIARSLGKKIATDVHTISSMEDEYNRDFMAAADILFMSDELLPESPEDWARQVGQEFCNEVVVIGLGERGALLYLHSDRSVRYIEAVQPRQVVNTIGAGDSLFSAFLHFYGRGVRPVAALEHAVAFAGYKVGENGAAEGFLGEEDLLRLRARLAQKS